MALFLGQQRLGVTQSSFAGMSLQTSHPVGRVSAPCRLAVSASIMGPGKKWEHYEMNKNKKVVRVQMHVKKGDTVQVIAGSDKGKVGEVSKVLTKVGKVVVDGVNVKFKTVQPKAQGEKGSIVQTESPVHHSNVMLYSKEKQIRSRVGHKFLEDGKKVRYLIKTGEIID